VLTVTEFQARLSSADHPSHAGRDCKQPTTRNRMEAQNARPLTATIGELLECQLQRMATQQEKRLEK